MYDAAMCAIPSKVESSHKRKNKKKETAQQSAQGPSSTLLCLLIRGRFSYIILPIHCG
jgi:hypothetical protein